MGLFKPNREKIIKQLEDCGYTLDMYSGDYNFITNPTEASMDFDFVFKRPTTGIKTGTAIVVFSCVFSCVPSKVPTMFAAIIPDDNESPHIPLTLYPYELQLFAKFMRTLT